VLTDEFFYRLVGNKLGLGIRVALFAKVRGILLTDLIAFFFTFGQQRKIGVKGRYRSNANYLLQDRRLAG